WPGIASRLPPNGGIQNEWITSADVIAIRTGLPDGTCSSLAVVRPRSRYLNSHHHWWPMTSTLRASAGASPAVAKIVRTVGTATNTRIAAGARVQAISISVWPCVGLGAGRPSRWRKRISVMTSSVSTTRNTPAAHQKMPVKSWSIAEPKSDRGSSVVCGNGPPQPATHSAAVSSQSRYRGTASRALGVGHGQRPGTLAGASPDVNEARLQPCEHPRPPASRPRNGVPPGAGARRRWDEPRVPRRGDPAGQARGGQGPAARARRGDQRRAVPSRDPAGGLAAAPTHRAAARGRRRGRPVLLHNAPDRGRFAPDPPVASSAVAAPRRFAHAPLGRGRARLRSRARRGTP